MSDNNENEQDKEHIPVCMECKKLLFSYRGYFCKSHRKTNNDHYAHIHKHKPMQEWCILTKKRHMHDKRNKCTNVSEIVDIMPAISHVLKKSPLFFGEKSKLKRLSKLYRFATKKAEPQWHPLLALL